MGKFDLEFCHFQQLISHFKPDGIGGPKFYPFLPARFWCNLVLKLLKLTNDPGLTTLIPKLRSKSLLIFDTKLKKKLGIGISKRTKNREYHMIHVCRNG